MRTFNSALTTILALAGAARACSDAHDGHAHDHELHRRLPPSAPLTPPSRPLEWGDINVLHTTDSHGWLLGHQKLSFPEPNYSGDFGDFASFVKHIKDIARRKGVDFLLVDSGDLHDGTGLSDGYPPGGVDAQESNKFFSELPYDILAIGNHELYIYNNTLDMHQNFAPKFPGRYLSSNVNITVTDKHGVNKTGPVGSRYAKFKTDQGRKVTALGVLFDFTGYAKGTYVQKVADMVKERWFAEAIAEEPDFFLLVGHMPVSKDNWPLVTNAIRAIHPHTPIMVFGGHTHIRDCVQFDGRSMALESGRYMETLGWMSMKLPKKHDQTSNLTFTRRYLDPNRITYEYHTSTSNKTFDTSLGQKITRGLQRLAQRFSLDFQYGIAPHDYTLSQAPYPSENSLLDLFIANVTPTALAYNNSRAATHPSVILTNSGSQRFDIYAGPFTKNDQLTVSPFADAFLYIPNVPAGVAKQLLPLLNKAGEQKRAEEDARRAEMYGRGYVDDRYYEWLRAMDERGGVERRAAKNATLGYVTTDSCPGVGDDTLHAPLPYYSSPAFVQSNFPAVADNAPIDLVFVDFIESQLLTLLNQVQTTKTYAAADVQTYSPYLSNQVLGIYAQLAWNASKTVTVV